MKKKEFNTYTPWSTQGRLAAHREVVSIEREQQLQAWGLGFCFP